MGHHHKRRWKPLLAHQVCGGIRWYLLLGSSKNSPLVPPGGACENVNPHGGESTCPGRKGGLINRGANEQQGEEAQRGGGGSSIDPNRGTSS